MILMRPASASARKRKFRKSAESEAVLKRLEEYLNSHYEGPMKWLVRFWQDQGTVITYKELRNIVTDEEDPQSLFDDWFQDYSKLLTEQITPLWKETMENAWRENPTFAGLDSFAIDSSDTNVANWITSRGAQLVTNCVEEQKSAIQYIVAETHSKMMPSAEAARYIRPIIGLTRPQAEANLKHYLSVKENLAKDHPRMKPESIERKARESAAKYAAKQQRYRAETIARTEMAYAYNFGNDEAIRQGISQGLLPNMVKELSTSHSGKVCQACQQLEGVQIGMDQSFMAITGKKVIRTTTASLPPFHPGCACAVKYVEVEKTIAKPVENDTIKPTIISDAHSTPKIAEANAILDHIGKNGMVETRVFYNESGYKSIEITVHDHGNPKLHPYGEKGEHVHEYVWNKDGSLKSRIVRELTSRERKENRDIL